MTTIAKDRKRQHSSLMRLNRMRRLHKFLTWRAIARCKSDKQRTLLLHKATQRAKQSGLFAPMTDQSQIQYTYIRFMYGMDGQPNDWVGNAVRLGCTGNGWTLTNRYRRLHESVKFKLQIKGVA